MEYDVSLLVNDSALQQELLCAIEAANVDVEEGFCLPVWDRILCWPVTPAGTVAILPCFEELNGIKYDTSQNASRRCQDNGTWDNYTDYTACKNLLLEGSENEEEGVITATTLYFIGYAMSLIALSIAIWIFIYFKDLRCLRNTIHTNLMTTYMLADFFWILTLTLHISTQLDAASCVVLVILLHYFHLTNFFWMFVEGLYLYVLVVETFTAENIKLRVYVIIGWGAPVVIVVLWSIIKSLQQETVEPMVSGSGDVGMMRHCSWWSPHNYDWIYQGPAVGVLCVNSVFLVMIMWVLITKLRSTNNAETQQYRKATKALLVLIPLLGITYILVIVGPTEGISGNIYNYIRAVLISTQGFTIALFYCFLNTEVQNTMKNHWDRWKEARDLGGNRKYAYNSKDWSHRSRTESIRLSIPMSSAPSTAVTGLASTSPNYGTTLSVENAL